MEMNVSAYLIKALKEHGVKRIFGVPGDFIIRFFQEVENDPDMELHTCHYEPELGYIADGSFRATRELAVISVTYGVGGLNVVNSVSHAYNERIPLLIISGAPGKKEKSFNMNIHHQAKTHETQFRVFKEICQDALVVDDLESAATSIERAIQTAKAFSRPVYLEIPRDCLNKLVPVLEKTRIAILPNEENPGALAMLREKWKEAKTIVLLAGIEIDRMELGGQLKTLAHDNSLPVFEAMDCKGLTSTLTDHSFGAYFAGVNNPNDALFDEADLIVNLGVLCSDALLTGDLVNRANVITAYDNQLRFGKDRLFDAISLETVIAWLIEIGGSPQAELPPKKTMPLNQELRCLPKKGSLGVDRITLLVEEYLEQSGEALFVDVGQCLWSSALFTKAVELYGSFTYTTMGYSLPAAIGFEVSSGRKPVVLIGDGAMQMVFSYLPVVKAWNLSPLILVLNNGKWLTQNAFLKAKFNELGRWDFSGAVEGLGMQANRLTDFSELRKLLSETPGRTQPVFVDLQLPDKDVSKMLIEFAKRLRNYSIEPAVRADPVIESGSFLQPGYSTCVPLLNPTCS